jgi:hypothetical protein
MKKTVKKLSLHRETVRNLVGSDLSRAAGGTYTSSFCLEPTACECGGLDSHFDHTCGSVCDIPSWHC